jgi:RNA recognition motif-containing protein
VRNIPYDLSVEEFEALFGPHGTITSHNIMMRGACRVAYVNYSTPQEAHAALSLNGHAVNDRNLMVALYRSFSERNPGLVAEGSPLRRMRAESAELQLPRASTAAGDEPTYVVVRDWPSTIADDTTRELLSIFNGLTRCRIVPASLGRSKAQLLFESRQFAFDAAEVLHGIDVEGHRLRAQVVRRSI